MKTVTKTVEVVDKFVIEGVLRGFDVRTERYYMDPLITIDVADENGFNSKLQVNKEFFELVRNNLPGNTKIQIEVKIL